jgi:probable rRNA maturation factor
MTNQPLDLDVTIDERVTMPPGFAAADIEQVVAKVLRAESATGPWEVSVAFTSDAELQVLHRDYLDDDSPTDIMTFPFEVDGDWAGMGDIVRGGDIAISVDRAAEQAAEGNWSTPSELKFLVAHGVLHLLGWDDSTPEKRVAMLDRQRAILEQM